MTTELFETSAPANVPLEKSPANEVVAPPVDLALPATRLVPPPVAARRVARFLFLTFAVLLIGLLALPWQQNVSGSGELIAFAPKGRQQTIGAPIEGVVLTWFVQEGAELKAGDPVVEMSDNDAQFVDRINTQRDSAEAQRRNYFEKVESLRALVANSGESLTAAVAGATAKVSQAEQKLRAARQKLEAADAAFETARLNVERQRALRSEGLVSQRDLEVTILKATKSRTERDAAQAELTGAGLALGGARQDLNKARADGSSKVEDTRAKLNAARAELAGVEAKLAEIDVKLARQAQRIVRAPVDGILLQVLALPRAQQVKKGESLGVIVPAGGTRAAALVVDGNDAAIVTPGRRVRLQFEGWPAVQFAGWPSVAAGTFGGRVQFVDSASNQQGNFRVVVMPDEEDQPWPEDRFLRLGARTKGWILLDEVSLGYELWRRFNGFRQRFKVRRRKRTPDLRSR